jgi:hypothetical protein
MKDSFKLNSDVFSTLHSLIFEEPCPRCGVLIQKNGGCKHMVCGKCKHEFCWLCLAPYYSYTHSENRYCPYRNFAVIGSIVLSIFFLNQKLFYFSTWFYLFEHFLYYWVICSLVADLLIFTLAVYLPLGGFLIDSINNRNFHRCAAFKITGVMVLITAALAFHLCIFYHMFFKDNPFLYHLFECFVAELALATLIGICYLTFCCVLYIIRINWSRWLQPS